MNYATRRSSENPLNFAGKIVLVTGGSRGVGGVHFDRKTMVP